MARPAYDPFLALLILVLSPLVTPEAHAAPSPISLNTFRSQVSTAQGIVDACRTNAAACQSQAIPEDADVQAGRIPGFHADWQWLHEALNQAANAPPAERSAAMEAASGRLNEWSTQATGAEAGNDSAAALTAARAAATRILARDEFRTDAAPTWLERQIARLQDALLRLLGGMAGIGARNSWIAPLIEWLCFGLAAAGLLFFIRRSLSRQALRISLSGTAPAGADSGKSTADWLGEADAAEAAGNGRETVHCLYWAAVASLEARKAWRPNPTRTPREYLRLLQSGSPAEKALRSLTRHLERSWYGSAEPSIVEIQAARGSLMAMEAGALNHNPRPSSLNLANTASASTGVAG